MTLWMQAASSRDSMLLRLTARV